MGTASSGPRRRGPGPYLIDRSKRGFFHIPDHIDATDPEAVATWVRHEIVELIEGTHPRCIDDHEEPLRYMMTHAVEDFMPLATFQDWLRFASDEGGQNSDQYARFTGPITKAQRAEMARRIRVGDDDTKGATWHKFILGNMDPRLRDRTAVEHTGRDGKPIAHQQVAPIDVSKVPAPDKVAAALRALELHGKE